MRLFAGHVSPIEAFCSEQSLTLSAASESTLTNGSKKPEQMQRRCGPIQSMRLSENWSANWQPRFLSMKLRGGASLAICTMSGESKHRKL